MIILSDSMCTNSGLPLGSSATDLIDSLNNGTPSVLDGLLTTEASREEAAGSLAEYSGYELRLAPQICKKQEKYCSVIFDGLPPVKVALISDLPIQNIPTDMENLIFWASIDSRLGLHQAWREEAHGLVVDWRTQTKGMAIVAEPVGLGVEGRQIVSSIFGLECSGVTSSHSLPALAANATTIKVSAPPNIFSTIQARLLFESAFAAHPKWRCLSLYRILENAYLDNIKKTLLSEFDEDPKTALESAKKKVASEINQLIHLTETSGLKVEFENFNTEFTALLGLGNRYIIMTDKNAQEEQLYNSAELYKKSVVRFYKIRCSIAHAGTSSIIYEQFDDADDAIIILLPFIEAIAMKSLKTTIF